MRLSIFGVVSIDDFDCFLSLELSRLYQYVWAYHGEQRNYTEHV
jgi:hypothetical protein